MKVTFTSVPLLLCEIFKIQRMCESLKLDVGKDLLTLRTAGRRQSGGVWE